MNPAVHVSPPRLFFNATSTTPVLPDPGLPQDRHARIAARRSFVGLKHQFMTATAALDGMRGDWLRWQVRQTQEPVDLWMLRGAVFAALDMCDDHSLRTRTNLSRVLDNVFPDQGELMPWGLRA